MRPNRILLLLVVVAAVAIGWLLVAQTGATPPPAPKAPSSFGPTDATSDAPLIRDAWPNAGVGERVAEAPDRLRAVMPDTSDERLAAVTIQVVVSEPGRADVPAPFVEVALLVGAGAPVTEAGNQKLTMCAITDGLGIATFEVRGGDDRPARATCALGSAVEFRLLAGELHLVTLRLKPNAIAQGRVVDASGQGIAGADLVFLPWTDATANPPRLWHLGHSAGDGSFRLALTAGGRIGALHPAYAASPMFLVRADNSAAEPPITPLLLSLLSRELHLPGLVVDGAGKPVADAELEFRVGDRAARDADMASVPQRVRSRSDGTFVVTNLAAGHIDYAVRAKGYGRLRGALQLAIDTPTPFEIRLPPACIVQGCVKLPTGDPVADALVTAGEPGAFDSATIRTAADGSYRLVDLGPGPNRMSARLDRNGERGQAQAVVSLTPAAPTTWDAVLGEAAKNQLLGTVVDTDNQPLAGWRIEMRRAGQPGLGTQTAADGAFAFGLGNVKRCDINVYPPGPARPQFAAERRRDVDQAAGPLRIVVDLRRPHAVLRGRVMTSEQEAVAADIECWHQERAEWVRFRAGADGNFVIPGVPVGTLDLVFRHPGHCPVTRADLMVAANDDRDLGIITLGAAGSMSGQVTGPDGRAPEICELFLVRGDDRIRAEYAAGTYRFAAAPPGRHTLQVQGPTLAAATFDVTITAGVDWQCAVQMKAGVLRRFRVLAPAAAGNNIALGLREPGKPWLWSSSVPVQRDGTGDAEVTFLACMAPGDYEAVAWGREGYSVLTSVTFQDGDDSEVRMQLVHK